ncbi:MFS transporter [Amycolatopsis sp. A133]|uniref:MFS transporter n=1 Tax=Amycolatopsis sp. A133 TaxID=3064472 RepID=UPI0027F52A9F|nr:MFS transporter [Amycolatopsis sp. A133]MDQ7807497.1 MFS transporter [Amycolatopsis sp. A133]
MLLTRPGIRLFLAGQTLSLFGDGVALIALGVWAKVLTGSSSVAALVMFTYMAPTVLLPLGGVLADRVRRRPLLVGTNLAVALASAALLLVDGPGDVGVLYAVAAAYGAASAVLSPAQSALLRSMLVEEAEFGAAAGLSQSVRSGTTLLSPVAGATVYGWIGGHGVAVVAMACLLTAALAFATLPDRERPARRERTGWAAELTAGLHHVRGSAEIRPLLVAMVTMTAVIGLTSPMLLALIEHGLHRPPTLLGVLESVLALGGLAGAVGGSVAIARFRPQRLVVAGALVFALGTALQAVAVLPVVVAGLVLAGAAGPLAVIGLATVAQAATPDHVMGRTQAAVNLCLTVPQAAALGAGSGLVALLSFRQVIALMVLGALVTAVALSRRRPAPVPTSEERGRPS